MGELSVASELRASPEAVWQHATDAVGMNRELRPWLRMTFPGGSGDFLETWRPGERLFRAWILLFGVIPIEYDDVTIWELEPGRRFLERSPMLTQRVWEHERTIEPLPGGCRLTDRVRFVPRLGLLGPVLAPVFRAVFRWRHHKLRRIFGALPALAL